jgi:hypothetical protein
MFVKNPEDGTMIGPGNPKWNSVWNKIVNNKKANRIAAIKNIFRI